MSSKWKLKYVARYKGRGNCWIKIPFSSPASKAIKKKLLSFKEKGFDIENYVNLCSRKEFYWLRYHKIIGNEDNPFVVYEIRISGSKVDHKANLISIPAKISEKFELLGNTPHKLNLELSDQELLLIQKKNEVKVNKEESNNVKEEAIESLPNLMSYPEGSISPLVSFRLSGRSDKVLFEDFLLTEGAISEDVI